MPEKKIRTECLTCQFFTGNNPDNATCQAGKEPTCYRKKKTCQKHKSKGKKAIVYTDGSYNKNTGFFGYAMVLEPEGEDKVVLSGQKRDIHGGWQIEGELTAVKIACEKAAELGCEELEIRYDYLGVENWVNNKWRTNKTYTREYADFMKEMKKKMKITFTHVTAHTGEEGNEEVDLLAKKACGLR